MATPYEAHLLTLPYAVWRVEFARILRGEYRSWCQPGVDEAHCDGYWQLPMQVSANLHNLDDTNCSWRGSHVCCAED